MGITTEFVFFPLNALFDTCLNMGSFKITVYFHQKGETKSKRSPALRETE